VARDRRRRDADRRVGIGFFIWDAWNSSHISEIILALFYVGIIGFVLDRMIAVWARS